MGSVILNKTFLGCCCCSVAQSCLTLCNPMNCSTPGFFVLHCLPECLLKLMSIAVMVPSNYWILSCPLLFLPSVFPSIRVFSNEVGSSEFSSVQSLSRVRHFATQWTAACQVSQSFANSREASGGQSIGASTAASVLPMNIQGWFPLRLTGLISLLSKGFSRVFSSTAVWKHHFFSAQPFLCSNCHIHTWLLEKP